MAHSSISAIDSHMNNHMPTVALLLPTYNEAEGLRTIFPKINRDLFDDILVVDGGSTDGSWEYAIEQEIRVMTQLRKGLGFAVLDAIDTLETDYVIEFSMDGNCLPEDLEIMVEHIKQGYDVVQMSRYLPPAKSEDDSLITAFGNWMFSRLIRYLGKFPVTDSLNIYRGFRRNIMDYPEFRAFLYGPVFEPLITAVANQRGLKMIELPSDEPKRLAGESKMRVIYNGSCIMWMVMRMYLFKWKLIRP